jgi:outer membrane protein assembly factor BamB
MPAKLHIGFLCLACALAAPARPADFADPAPPAVNEIKPHAAPAARPQPELTSRAAPRALANDAVTSDWPDFAGPTRSPISPETKLRSDLKDLPIVWEVEKGAGYAHPSILGDRLILFHRVKNEEVVECLQPVTGQRYWRFAYPCEYEDRYGYTNGPRCAPAIDKANSLVFTHGVEGKLHALDLTTGQVLWKRDLLADFKLTANFFGVGASPLLEQDNVIINVGAKDACVVAFAPKTGRVKWATPAPKDWGPSYASPISATVHGLRRVFVFAGGESRPATGGLLCIDPADGTTDFAFPWRGKRYESVNASSPLIFDDKVYVAECYGKGGALLQLSLGEDKKLSYKSLWENDKLSTHFMTALPLAGHLYGCDGHGPANCPLVCVDLATGEEKWRTEPDLSETVKTPAGEEKQIRLNSDRCNLLHADGKTLCLTEWGHLLYLDLSPAGVKIASRTWLFAAQETWSPPVLSRGLLYVNQNQKDGLNRKPARLICYDLRGN